MTKRFILFGIILCFFSCLPGCGKLKEKGGKELVKINDVSISLEDFRQMSEGQSLEGKMRLLNEKGLRDFLETYVITREVLYQEAKKKGLDQRKEIVAKVEDFKRAMVIDSLLNEALSGKAENLLGNEEVRRAYLGM